MRGLLVLLIHSFSVFLYAFDSTIPVLHLPDYFNQERRSAFLKELDYALRESGFFAVTGVGVDSQTLDTSYEGIKEFFALDLDLKSRLKTSDGQRGFSWKESAKGDSRVDFKEFYHMGKEFSLDDPRRKKYVENLWPENPQAFRPAMENLYLEIEQFKEVISEILNHFMGQGLGFLQEKICEGDCLLRAIYYPANPPPDAIWASAHTDINLFTILPRSTSRGLQVLNKQGEWVEVIVPDNAFIVNCGDMLENLTNGYFRSSMHRVVDSGYGKDRYSAVFFVQAKSDISLDPLPNFIIKAGGKKCRANVTSAELLAERLIDLGRAPPEMMKFFIDSGAINRLKEVGRFSSKAEKTLLDAGYLY